MIRTILRLGIPLGLALIVAGFGVSMAQAHFLRQRVPPWLPPAIPYCIDFDSSTVCPVDSLSDGDGYPDDVELRLGSDPHDTASTPESGLLDEQTGLDTCRDGIDNDGDGRTDRWDFGCWVTCRVFTWSLACSDRDHDGWLQYVELAYGSNPNRQSSTPESSSLPGTCFDGVDNDGDGFTDDADSSCLADGLADCIDFTGDADCPPL